MVGNACASGHVALLCAVDLLRAGRADAVVVSAATQELDPVGLQGWALMDAIVWRSFADDPTRASRPLDARREGFVPCEGAGAVILEGLDLSAVPPGRYEVFCLPLKIRGGDGAPARVVLRTLD